MLVGGPLPDYDGNSSRCPLPPPMIYLLALCLRLMFVLVIYIRFQKPPCPREREKKRKKNQADYRVSKIRPRWIHGYRSWQEYRMYRDGYIQWPRNALRERSRMERDERMGSCYRVSKQASKLVPPPPTPFSFLPFFSLCLSPCRVILPPPPSGRPFF